MSGLQCALDDVAGLVDHIFDVAASLLDSLFGFLAETLGLLLEVVGGVFEVVACVLDSLAELLARFGAGLWSVKESDGGSCGDADSEGEPVVFCDSFDFTSCFLWLASVWIRTECDWLV